MSGVIAVMTHDGGRDKKLTPVVSTAKIKNFFNHIVPPNDRQTLLLQPLMYTNYLALADIGVAVFVICEYVCKRTENTRVAVVDARLRGAGSNPFSPFACVGEMLVRRDTRVELLGISKSCN